MSVTKAIFLGVFFCFCASSISVFAFEDIRYDITARFDPHEKTIEAQETVRFTNDTGRDLPEITLRVYPHHRLSAREKINLYKYAGYFKADLFPDGFDPGAFLVRSVRIGGPAGAPAVFSYEGREETVLRIVLPRPLKDGASLSLSVDFFLKIPHKAGRYGWHRRTFALNRWYPLLSVFDKKDGWLNHPDYLLHMPYVSDAAAYRLRLELPRGYIVASGCDEVQESEGPGGLKVVELSNSSPLRELTLAISRDYEIFEKTEDGVTVKSYHFKNDKEAARSAAEAALDFIRWFSGRIAPYPSRQFSIAPVALGYGGSQNAGIIFLDARVYQIPGFLARYFEFLVAHETGHQWWYNVVGNDEFRELWLDEGLNSYWVMRYLEAKYGPDARLAALPKWVEFFIPNPRFKDIRDWRYLYFARRGLDQPVLTDMESFYEPALIFTVAYGKGSVVFEMLAERLGEKKFLELMKRYHERFRFRIARVTDFIDMASESAGEDLAPFFKKWLATARLYDHALRRAKGGLILERREALTMPVEVRARFQDGATEIFSSDGEKEREEVSWRGAEKIIAAAARGSGSALDIDRVNNFVPRRLRVRLVPVYHGLYDMPLFLDRDAYAWTTGPSVSDTGVGIKTSFQKPDDYSLTLGSAYDFGGQAVNSSVGFEKKQCFRQYMSWGVEFLNRDARASGESDLRSYKLTLRQELDFPSTVFEASSHATLYLLHNQPLGRAAFLAAKEEARGLRYRQNKETIFGAVFLYSNAGALPDPAAGYKLAFNPEVAGHLLGGQEAFVRASLEWNRYVEAGRFGRVAWRLKAGVGHPKDKGLFYLGSDRELRGYDFKTITGSNVLLGSTEYRFPLLRDIDSRLFWRMLTLDQIQGVVFFDAGSAWSGRSRETGFKKDVGFGLRFYFNVAGSAERFAVRVDAAQPLDGAERDTHVWLGVNHAF